MPVLRRLALFSFLPAFLLAGCANHDHTDQQTKQNEPPPQDAQLASADAANRIRDIQSRVNAFEAASRQLPGETVQQKLDQLDTTHGGMNRVVAAQASRESAGVLQQLSAALADRAGLETNKPTTRPSSASAVQ